MKLEEELIKGDNVIGNENNEESQSVTQLEEELLNIIENIKGIESKVYDLEDAEAHLQQTFRTRVKGMRGVIYGLPL